MEKEIVDLNTRVGGLQERMDKLLTTAKASQAKAQTVETDNNKKNKTMDRFVLDK